MTESALFARPRSSRSTRTRPKRRREAAALGEQPARNRVAPRDAGATSEPVLEPVLEPAAELALAASPEAGAVAPEVAMPDLFGGLPPVETVPARAAPGGEGASGAQAAPSGPPAVSSTSASPVSAATRASGEAEARDAGRQRSLDGFDGVDLADAAESAEVVHHATDGAADTAPLPTLGAEPEPELPPPAPHAAGPGATPPGPATAAVGAQAVGALDMTEVLAAVQDTVATLAAAPDSGPNAAGHAAASPGRASATRRSGSRRGEAAVKRRDAAGREPAEAGRDAVGGTLGEAAAQADTAASRFARVEPASAEPGPAGLASAVPLSAEPAWHSTPGDADAFVMSTEPLSGSPDERIRALQGETHALRRTADAEMRRVNRLLLALAVVLFAALVALAVQMRSLSAAHDETVAAQQRIDQLTTQQGMLQAGLAAAQQRADVLDGQLQHLTNRLAAVSRQAASRRKEPAAEVGRATATARPDTAARRDAKGRREPAARARR